jgi:hypothetical protein
MTEAACFSENMVTTHNTTQHTVPFSRERNAPSSCSTCSQTHSYFYRPCNQMHCTYLYRHSKHNPYICQAIWKHYACNIFPFSIKWCCSINNRQTWQTVSVYEIMSTGSTITIAGCALFNKTYWKGMVHAYRVNRTSPNSYNILWFNACMMRHMTAHLDHQVKQKLCCVLLHTYTSFIMNLLYHIPT